MSTTGDTGPEGWSTLRINKKYGVAEEVVERRYRGGVGHFPIMFVVVVAFVGGGGSIIIRWWSGFDTSVLYLHVVLSIQHQDGIFRVIAR